MWVSVPTVRLRELRSGQMHLQGCFGCSSWLGVMDATTIRLASMQRCGLGMFAGQRKGPSVRRSACKGMPSTGQADAFRGRKSPVRLTATASCTCECRGGSCSQLQPCGSCCPAKIQHRHAHDLRLLAVLSDALFLTTAV